MEATQLDEIHSVQKTTEENTYIFATVREFGQLVKDPNTGAVTLDDSAMWELVNWFTDGSCPLCSTSINVGEIICDDCYELARAYRQHIGIEILPECHDDAIPIQRQNGRSTLFK